MSVWFNNQLNNRLKHEHLVECAHFVHSVQTCFYFPCIIFQLIFDRSRNVLYLSPTETCHCSGNWMRVVCAEKQDTRCLKMNSPKMKWLFKGIMTGRQTSGSNSPLYAGLAVLRLFLSWRLLWISGSNKNTIHDESLHPNISVFVCFCVSLFHCFIQSSAEFRIIGLFQIWIWR